MTYIVANETLNLTHSLTPTHHRAVHKAGRWVWSTGDGRRSTADNPWRRSTCRREIIQFRDWGKAPERITLMFGDIWISHLFDKYSPASGGFVP